MGRRCCVCKMYAVSGSGISFHSFPLIDSYRKQWIDAIPIRVNINNANLLICSQHFNESDFKFGRYGKRYLPKAAIPSKFEAITSDFMIVENIDTPVEIVLEDSQFTTDEAQDFLPFEDAICSSGTVTPMLSIQADSTNNVVETNQSEPNITDIKCFALSKKKYRVTKWEKYFKQCNEALIRSTNFHDYLGESLVPCNYEFIHTETVVGDEQVVDDQSVDFVIATDQELIHTDQLKDSEVCGSSDTESAPENDLALITDLTSSKSVTRTKKQRVRNLTPKHYDKLKRQLTMAKNVITQKKKKIKILQQNKRRLQKKVCNMSNVINELKASKIIPENSDLASLPPSSTEVVKRFLQGSNTAKYSPELKKFAVTLFFYSRKAYEYVRNVFNDSLPHPRTIAKWFEKDNESGIQVEPLQCLTDISDIL